MRLLPVRAYMYMYTRVKRSHEKRNGIYVPYVGGAPWKRSAIPDNFT